jgi:hypothetical protein
MALKLDYSLSKSRRRWFVFGVAVIAILASGVLAIRKYQAFESRQEQRATVRRKVEAYLSSAKRLIDQKRIDDAALALLQAEFPRHTEAGLFWQSELDAFDRPIEEVHQRIEQLNAALLKDREIQRAKAKREREAEELDGPRNVIANYVNHDWEESRRLKTVAALENRGAELLKAGNNQNAWAVCAQLISIDPAHRFDAKFWANIPR